MAKQKSINDIYNQFMNIQKIGFSLDEHKRVRKAHEIAKRYAKNITDQDDYKKDFESHTKKDGRYSYAVNNLFNRKYDYSIYSK